MADQAQTAPDEKGAPSDPSSTERAPRRKIQGNLPYTSSPGVLRRVLERIPASEKPSVFNNDFLGTVLNATGGAARPIIPIFKATGLLTQSSAPTELYSQFQTDSGRSGAALQALKNGFAEIFRRNQFAHRADENTLIDIIIAVTGLPRNDQIARYILNTFQAFQELARSAREDASKPEEQADQAAVTEATRVAAAIGPLGLVYNINVVLPETTNIDVYNAIFKSLRGNLLQ